MVLLGGVCPSPASLHETLLVDKHAGSCRYIEDDLPGGLFPGPKADGNRSPSVRYITEGKLIRSPLNVVPLSAIAFHA